MGYRNRQGKQPGDPQHSEGEVGQVPLAQVEADTEVPAPADTDVAPDIVTEPDNSGVAGGSSGSSGGGSTMPGHPDATR
ncbi:preprotein translocase YidC [Micromonospora inaquosa]|uniref:Preprotein translocase YidC n=1 Tax=Micromonospora inaquosa TaxID=2203716 RepID=A0A3N9WBN6_9ACTN|nr:preprotein translocase YidC [Micromonospora inaquosa]RQW98343.1 preprotein translocase YidC [Micromonospora inaquosa]